MNEKGLASGVVFLDREGGEHRLKADIVVMAANGIGTPRLLLMSTSPRFPQGLANSSGLVGRRLQLNPTPMVIGVYDEPLNSWLGPAGQNVHSFEFYETDASRGHVLGASWGTMPTGGPYAASFLGAGGGAPTHGPGLMESVSEVLGHSVLGFIITHDLPNEDNRVELDPVLKDSSGLPAPRITYKQDQNNIDLVKFHLSRVSEALMASGARRTIEFPSMPEQPGHLLGSTRMGTDPATSVVDQFGRSHDVPNLFIVDGGVFVTSGAVSPTSTISAIALRCAEDLVNKAAEQETPS